MLELIILGLVCYGGLHLLFAGIFYGPGVAKEKKLLNDKNQLQAVWNARVRELNIDLEQAVRMKYYPFYYEDKESRVWAYYYWWPVEGAIAGFMSPEGDGCSFKSSPSTWNIFYFELRDLDGVYRRDNLCLLCRKKKAPLGFPIEEYEKLKKVYDDAKAMTA